MTPITIYEGPSQYNGAQIVATACLGGNTGTGKTLDITVAPASVRDAMQAFDGPGGQRGGSYVKALQSTIDSVCHRQCSHKGKNSCYAQHNARSAGQPAKQLANSVRTQDPRDAWQSLCKMASLSGFRKLRLCTAGSSGALPPDVIDWIMSDAESAGLGRLAYLESWRSKDAQHLKGSHMASTQSIKGAEFARSRGWGSFTSVPVPEFVGGYTLPEGATLCPKSAEAKEVHGLPITCDACGLCDGSKDNWIVVPSHGPGDAARKRSKLMQGVEIRDASGVVVGRFKTITK